MRNTNSDHSTNCYENYTFSFSFCSEYGVNYSNWYTLLLTTIFYVTYNRTKLIPNWYTQEKKKGKKNKRKEKCKIFSGFTSLGVSPYICKQRSGKLCHREWGSRQKATTHQYHNHFAWGIHILIPATHQSICNEEDTMSAVVHSKQLYSEQ